MSSTTTSSTTTRPPTSTVAFPALTTIFTPPASCATDWVGFTRGAPEVPKETYVQRIMEDRWINFKGCYPATNTASNLKEVYGDWIPLVYSPGICPSGYTTQLSSYGSFSGGAKSMEATCCPVGYTYFTAATWQRYIVYSKSRYCTARYQTYITALDASEGFKPSLRTTTSRVYGDGMKVVNAITVKWERSDLSLFPKGARPEVGSSDLENMGDDRSLVFTPGQAAPTDGASNTARETRSRSGGVRLKGWQVKDVMSLIVAVVILSIICEII